MNTLLTQEERAVQNVVKAAACLTTLLPKLGILILILGISGCCTAPVQEPPIGLPICERPIAVDAQIWNDLQLLRETMSNNQLVDQQCIEKLRDRIERHDGS